MNAPSKGPFSLFDIAHVTHQLEVLGVSLIRIIPQNLHKAMAAEIASCRFVKQREKYKNVAQLVELADSLPEVSVIRLCAEKLGTFLGDAFSEMASRPLRSPIVFNDISVLRYPPGSFGITPHVDMYEPQNLIATYSICGTAELIVRRDRKSSPIHAVTLDPGILALIRGIGFAGIQEPVMHEVKVTGWPRISIGYRQLPDPENQPFRQ